MTYLDGWYTVTELGGAGSRGYSVNSTAQEQFLRGGSTVVMTFEDVPLSGILIYKYDEVTKEALSNCLFQVRYLTDTSGTGGTVIGIYRTGSDGSVLVTGLHEGTYVVEELSSDAQHVISTAPQTAYLSGRDQDVVSLYFGNVPKGSVLLTKTDALSGAPLSGVEFFVTDSTGAVLGTENGKFTTGADGSVLIENLDPSVTVVARETRAKSGYILDETVQTAKVIPGETVTIRFTNQPKGNLVVEKYDKISGDRLAGATFRITAANGELISDDEGLTSTNGLYTTSAEGQIVLSKVTPTALIVTEVSAPEGYRIDPTPQTVVIQPGDTQTLRFYDDPLCVLTLFKRDAKTLEGLKGATFYARYSDGRTIGPNNGRYVSTEDGTVTITGLTPDATVLVSEESAPTGYIKSDDVKTIVVRSGEMNSLTFDNQPTQTLIIGKYLDGTSYEPVANAGFRVVDGSGAGVGPDGGTYYTSATGEIVLSDLAPGTVITAYEFKSPDGIELDGTPQTIEIKSGEVQHLRFFNKRLGTLVIKKYAQNSEKTPLAGVKFQLTYADGRYVDTANNHLSSNGIYYTSTDGEIRINGITGTIVATELAAIDGYYIDPNNRTQTVEVRADETQTLEFYNPEAQIVVIEKLISGTNKPLSGVTFLLTDANGAPIGGGNGYFVTDAAGRITVSVAPGSVVVAQEVATVKGYALNPERQVIQVAGSSVTVTDQQIYSAAPATTTTTTNSAGLTSTLTRGTNSLTFYDEELGTLTVHKYIKGTSNEPLANVGFEITDGSGRAVGPNGGIYYTGQNGSIVLHDIELGSTLTVREVSTVEGFQLNGIPQQIMIQSGNNELTFWNERLGNLVIRKLSSADRETPLEGVEFQLVYADGGYVDNANGQLSSNGIYRTNSNGEIRVNGIAGTVVATELRSIDGYSLGSDRTQTVVVRPGETQTLCFYNDPWQTVVLQKYIAGTTRPLAGVTYLLLDGSGAPIGDGNGQYVTDAAGRITLSAPVGTVIQARELSTVSGYSINPDVQTITVTAGSGAQTVVTNAAVVASGVSSGNSLTFYDSPLSTLKIRKYIKGTDREPLAGAGFLVTDGSGAAVGNTDGVHYSDLNGEVTIPNLEIGTVLSIREVSVPDGFILDGTPKQVKIQNSDVHEVVFWNARQGSLVVHTLNSITHEPIPGVTVKITTATGEAIPDLNGHFSSNGLYTSDAAGEIVLSGLNGTFVVTQTGAPSGYTTQEISRTQTVVVYPDDVQNLTTYCDPTQMLTVNLFEAGTTTPIEGAIFKVTASDGTVIGTANGEYTCDRAGQFRISGLIPGTTVSAKIIQIGSGFILNSTPQEILIRQGDAQSMTFYAEKKGALIIKLKDSASGDPINDAEFRITTISGAFVDDNEGATSTKGIYRVDESGAIRLLLLQPDTYIIEQLSTDSNHFFDSTSESVKVNAGDTQTLELKNEALQSVILQKYAEGTTDPLPGVTFYVTDGAGNPIGSNGLYVTGLTGSITIPNQKPGTTIIAREVSTVRGYQLNSAPQTLVVGSSIHSAASPATGGETANQLIFYDSLLSTLVVKTFVAGSDDEPLSGVTYEVTDGNGGKIGPGDGTYTCNAAGEIIIPELATGTVINVRQISVPDGLILNGTPKQVTIKSSDVHEVVFRVEKQGAVVIRAFDSTTKASLPGVSFTVFYTDGQPVNDANGHAGSGGTFVSDENGEIRISGVTGTILVTAQGTPVGYTIDPNSRSKTEVVAPDSTLTLDFYCDPLQTLTVKTYIAGTTTPLEGVSYKVTSSDGTVVGANNGEFISAADGTFRISNLVPGTTITAHQIRTVSGYVLADAPQDILIKSGEPQSLTFFCEPKGGLIIKLTDKASGDPIANAEIKVTTISGELVADNEGKTSSRGLYRTSENGEIRLLNLQPNTYIIEQTGTDSAHVADSETVSVRVDAGDTQTVELKNSALQSVTIIKRADDSGAPLAGVTFRVTDAAGTPIGSGEYTTGEDGAVTVSGLRRGMTIIAQEVRTVKGYTLNTERKTIVVGDGNSGQTATAGAAGASTGNTIVFYDAPKGNLVIFNYVEGSEIPIQGSRFLVTDGTGAGYGTAGGEYVCDENGRIEIRNIQPGTTLTVKQISVSKEFVLNPEPKSTEITSGDAQKITIYNSPKQALTIQTYVAGTTTPIPGVKYLITDSSGVAQGPSNGEYVGDKNGRIVLTRLEPGITITAKQVSVPDGFVIDPAPQSILIKQGEAQRLVFYNSREGGLELIKIDAADKGKRIPGTTFEIRRMDQGLVETVTTDRTGCARVDLAAGDYYAIEIEAAEGYQLDATPTYFTITDGKKATVTVTNKAYCGIEIRKTDSVTGEGIYGVSFLLYDSKNNVVGQYTSDNRGYVRILDITEAGIYRIRELENPGYIVDTQLKTVEVKNGEITLVEWKNTPITGQIQITKTSEDYNSMNGWPASTPIPNTVFEVYNRAGNLVDTIKTDKNGVAATKPLPLGRYKVVESRAADFYGLDKTPIEVEIEFAGQIVRAAMTNKSLYTNVSITKRGYAEVMPGQSIRYDFSNIANNSTTALESFYWRDTIPVQSARLDKVVTGTWNVRGSYKIVYQTNMSNGYRTLADNLATDKSYVLAASPAALGLGSNEYVTEVMFSFGVVPANFRQVEAPQIYCTILQTVAGGSEFVNTADVGGVYNGQWIMAVDRWVTRVYAPAKPLPRTGY